jgi:hypothetical protein
MLLLQLVPLLRDLLHPLFAALVLLLESLEGLGLPLGHVLPELGLLFLLDLSLLQCLLLGLIQVVYTFKSIVNLLLGDLLDLLLGLFVLPTPLGLALFILVLLVLFLTLGHDDLLIREAEVGLLLKFKLATAHVTNSLLFLFVLDLNHNKGSLLFLLLVVF